MFVTMNVGEFVEKVDGNGTGKPANMVNLLQFLLVNSRQSYEPIPNGYESSKLPWKQKKSPLF
jgi:hypothetical protein